MLQNQSQLFTKTSKEAPKDEVSVNAQLLVRGGFVQKLMAGVYSYLPLGLRVLRNIQTIIREEMDALGAQEILMPALTPKEIWETTKRWDEIDVLFKLMGAGDKEYALGSTHEEVVTPLVGQYLRSYKDLPLAVYQIQDKFRNEPRAKSGLLRGREFNMKDMYSFHCTQEDLDAFYERAISAYHRVFDRCGLDAKLVEASGGVFSKYSHEFQVFTPYGEDIIFECAKCNRYQNREIVEQSTCAICGSELAEHKAIEVGNIFRLGTRFTNAFDVKVTGEDGRQQGVLMGCYGIGPSRLLGSIVEIHHDEQGVVWPASVAPFQVHVVPVTEQDAVIRKAQEIALTLSEHGVDVLLDDRNARAGEKFADSDLLGVPKRIVVSERLLAAGMVELKLRAEDTAEQVSEADLFSRLALS